MQLLKLLKTVSVEVKLLNLLQENRKVASGSKNHRNWCTC